MKTWHDQVRIKNKESGVYPVVLSDLLAVREEGIENQHNNKQQKNAIEKIEENTTRANQFTITRINLLSRFQCP